MEPPGGMPGPGGRRGRPSQDDFYLRHPRMDVRLRAKIFIPFEPLKGFRQALAERERLANVTSRRDLSQEQREEISAKLSALSPGDMVRVSHYVEDHYELTVGQVVRVSVPDGTITVEKTTIRFGDLGSLDYL